MKTRIIAGCLLLGALATPGAAEESPARAGLRPIGLGRAATLPSVTRDRAAGLPSVTRDRAAGLPSVTRDRAAGLPSVTRDRAAGLSSVTRDRAAGLSPVTRGRAAGPASVSLDRAAGLAPVAVDRAAGLSPVTVDRAAGLASVGLDRAAGLAPVTIDRVAGLPGVTVDRAALLPPLLRDDPNARVVAASDGFLASEALVARTAKGFFEKALLVTAETPWGSAAYEERVVRAFRREGLAPPVFLSGGLADFVDHVAPYGPHRAGHRRARNSWLLVHRAASGGPYYDKGWQAIVVPAGYEERLPDDYDRAVRKTTFPLVMGDMAFKEGEYLKAALAFREAADRKPDSASARFAFADALVALQNYGYAATELRAGLAIAPKWGDRLDRRGVYGPGADPSAHLAELTAFVAERPEGADPWFLLGWLRMTSGDPEIRAEAAAAFREAAARDPGDRLALRYVALLESEPRPGDDASEGSSPER